jgi:exonuclease III
MAGALSMGTLNMHGSAKDRLLYVNKVMHNHDILMLQEHWLHTKQLDKLQSEVDNVCVHGVSGMESSVLLHGRPYGGTAIIWKKEINCSITPIEIHSSRACGVILDIKGFKVLLISIYMPTDVGETNLQTYQETLNHVSDAIHATTVDNIIIGGDWNTDFSRICSRHTIAMKQFLLRESLFLGMDLQNAKYDFTYESKATGARSAVDHFLISNNLVMATSRYDVVHDGDNLSDHALLSMNVNIPCQKEYINNNTSEAPAKPMWIKASSDEVEMYKIMLDNCLNEIQIPWDAVCCNNLACKNSTHSELLNEFHNDIVNACLAASEKHIPHSKSSSNVIAGWTDDVEPFRDKAIFWHNLWKDNGFPRNGVIADIRRQTRARYHLAVKQAKQNGDKRRAQKMADAILGNKSRDFWSEVKKVRRTTSGVPNQIDKVSGDVNISNHFANKYETVYNSVSYSQQAMSNLMGNIDDHIHNKCSNQLCGNKHCVTVEDVKESRQSLKYGKQDGYMGLYTDHILNGTDRLTVYLSCLFSSMITHGFTPEAMLISTLVPIPKNSRKSLNDSNNYRGIALSSAIGKLLDWILIKK